MLFAAVVACKTRQDVDRCHQTSELRSSATIANDTSYMVGGFLEISTSDGANSVQCDALIMPHTSNFQKDIQTAVSYLDFTDITLSVSRSCINPFQESRAYVTLYLGDYQNRYNPDGTEHYGYVKLPIRSAYLEELGKARSDFVAAYQGADGRGFERLRWYELMQTQMYRFYRADYKSAFEADGVMINDHDVTFFERLQIKSCPVGDSSLEMGVRPAVSYDRMVEKLEHSPSRWACFVYSDFAQFDAKIDLTDAQREKIRSFGLKNQLSDRVTLGEFHGLDTQQRSAIMNFVQEMAKKAYRDLNLLKMRVQDADIAKLRSPTNAEIEHFVHLQSYWRGLMVYASEQNLNVLQMTNRVLGNFGRFLKRTVRLPGSRSMLIPLERGGAALYAHPALSIVGNVTSQDQWMSWSTSSLPRDAAKTRFYHSFFHLLLQFDADEDQGLKHYQTGSMLLLGGYPFAVLKTVNREFVRWVKGAQIAKYDVANALGEQEGLGIIGNRDNNAVIENLPTLLDGAATSDGVGAGNDALVGGKIVGEHAEPHTQRPPDDAFGIVPLGKYPPASSDDALSNIDADIDSCD